MVFIHTLCTRFNARIKSYHHSTCETFNELNAVNKQKWREQTNVIPFRWWICWYFIFLFLVVCCCRRRCPPAPTHWSKAQLMGSCGRDAAELPTCYQCLMWSIVKWNNLRKCPLVRHQCSYESNSYFDMPGSGCVLRSGCLAIESFATKFIWLWSFIMWLRVYVIGLRLGWSKISFLMRLMWSSPPV